MAIELVVPKVGESIAEVEVVQWMKKEGEHVERDETIVVLDTAKTTVELPSPIAGTVGKILKQEGDAVGVGEALALLEEGGASASTSSASASQAAPEEIAPKPTVDDPEWQKPPIEETGGDAAPHANGNGSGNGFVMPAAERLLTQNNLQASDVAASGPGGRVLKEDVTRHLQGQAAKPTEGTGVVQGNPEISTIEQPAPKQPDGTAPQATPAAKPDTKSTAPVAAPASERATGQGEEKVRMSLLRREIARKLVEAQQTAALLTTFNEVDMGPVMAMRKEYQDAFTKKYGIKLGFMSFFVKAVIDALKAYPAINAEIRGNEIVYRNYFDIGVAIGGGKGLVVPTLRNAELMSFSQIEGEIGALAKRAKEGTLKPEELEGGTFSITNGGIYGSLLSTPIVNAPQSGILGMHAIQDRPVARDGQVVIRPMMYLALTYDHRIVDGREAVSFLVRIKECIENPARMLLEV